MKNDLIHITGFNIPNLPFQLEKVGDLLYFDGPLMSIFSDSNNMAYIYDWAESNSYFNRWLVYQIDTELLSDYIYGKATHFQLLNNPQNNIIFIVDKDTEGTISNCIICSPSSLPYEYLPQNDLKFEEDDAVNLDNIIYKFNLVKKDESKPFQTYDILEEAKKSKNELINLHIKSKNRKVGYGKIYSSILGQVLSNYTNICFATALNIFDKKGKIPINERPRRKKGELKEINDLAELEFAYVKAASFSIFLRPIKQNIDLFDNETSSEKITKTVFNLFNASNDINKLNELKNSLNEEMLSAYNSFLKEIKTQDISIGVQYANPKNELKLEESFNAKKAQHILTNLDSLEFQKKEELKSKGCFKALDSINATFKFETNEGDIFFGKFSNQLKGGICHFNLQDYYSVTIEILEIKKSGKKKIISKDTMVSCVAIEE